MQSSTARGSMGTVPSPTMTTRFSSTTRFESGDSPSSSIAVLCAVPSVSTPIYCVASACIIALEIKRNGLEKSRRNLKTLDSHLKNGANQEAIFGAVCPQNRPFHAQIERSGFWNPTSGLCTNQTINFSSGLSPEMQQTELSSPFLESVKRSGEKSLKFLRFHYYVHYVDSA